MIPKVIHFCWLSGDDYPEVISKSIESWKKFLPDYEFVLWDTKRFSLDDNIWVKQAFEAKKYAFAADYIRLYAVYNFGGIYLDTDVEVVKSLDPLLSRPYFIGSEGGGIVEAGVIGAEKGCEWVGECLQYYEGKSFIKPDGTYDMMTLPRIMMQQISKSLSVVEIPEEKATLPYDRRNLVMFPQDYFCAKNQGTGIISKTKNTYTIHHFAMSWVSKKQTFLADTKRKLIGMFGEKTIYGIINFLRLKEIRSAILKK